MALDALVTALACLSTPTVTTLPGSLVTNIMLNSRQPFHLDNQTAGCALGTVEVLLARVQYMAEELRSLKADLQMVQEFVDEYRSRAPLPALDARISPFLLSAPIAAAAAVQVDDTPRNCLDQKHGRVRIRLTANEEPFYVSCDQKERGGGWLVIAYRFDGSEDFNRDWHTYKTGFGSLNSEFFIGLDKLHRLTNSDDHELLIIMRKEVGEYFAIYDQFSIGSEAEKYILYVLGSYKGNAGNSLHHHAGKKFTTFDQDNDDNGQNCARIHAGAWWYGRDCIESNLFGTFQSKYGQKIGYYKGILWKTLEPGPTGSLRYVRMLIRPYRRTEPAPVGRYTRWP